MGPNMAQYSTRAHFAAQPIAGVWTQVETFKLSGDGLLPADSSLEVLAVVTDRGQFVNLSSFYQSLYLRLKSLVRYYSDHDLSALAKALQALLLELSAEDSELELELVVGFRFETDLVLGGCAGASATLIRGNRLGKIMDSQAGVKVITGKLQPADMLALSTKQFYVAFPYSRLQQLFLDRIGGVNLEAIASEMVVQLKRTNLEAGVGFVLVSYVPVDAPVVQGASPKSRPFSWLGRLSLRRLRWPRRIHVRSHRPRFNVPKKVIALLLVLTLIASTSTWLTLRHQRQTRIMSEFMERFEPALALVNQAEFEEPINILQARDTSARAKIIVDELNQQYSQETVVATKLAEINSLVTQLYARVSGETKVIPQLFHDLTLVEPNFFGEKLALDDERLWLLDNNNQQLFSLGVASKDPSPVIKGAMLTGARHLWAVGGRGYVWSNAGIYSWDQTGGTDQLELNPDPDWRQVSGFAVFASNLYIIDSQLGEIWRYRPTPGNNYSRERWLAPDTQPDLSQVVDVYIDGEIWLVSATGQLRRYSRGVGQVVRLEGWSPDWAVDSMVLDESNVYLLDRMGNRIIVFDKSGVYQKQLVWDELGLVTDIAIWQENLYLLAGGKVYRINLNQ